MLKLNTPAKACLWSARRKRKVWQVLDNEGIGITIAGVQVTKDWGQTGDVETESGGE